MNQQELEALLAQIAPNNDPVNRLTHTEGTDTVEVEERPKDPATGAEQTWADPVKRKVPVRVHTWVDKGTGMTLVVHANPDGTYTKISQGIDEKAQGQPSTTPAQQAAAAGASTRKPVEGKPGVYEVTTQQQQPDGSMKTETHHEDEAGNRVPTPTAAPQVAPGTLNTTSPQYAVVNPDGSVSWKPNPNYKNPTPKPIDLPNTRTVIWDNGDGTTRTEKNPNYVKKSTIMPSPSDPSRLINVTEDDNGNAVALPVDDKTTIKPADLPVLQAKYGEIAQGLGALAQDLNSRYAGGEITEKQRQDAFTAAHQQAQTQVSEINSIFENSRAIWTGQVNQRATTLGETQSRRAYASDIFGRAAQTGMSIAESAGPGHGADIAGGVGALMSMGQRYAEGMGGFRESPEVALPAALQQAQGIGLPGYGATGAAGAAAPSRPGGAPGPAAAASAQHGMGLPPPIFGPPPAVTGSVGVPGASPPARDDWRTNPGAPGVNPVQGQPGHDPTQPVGMAPGMSGAPAMGGNPLLAAMSQQLQSGFGFTGSPVAAGGLGVYDPTQDMQRMVGDGTDPDWAQAVQQAAAAAAQPGYAWQRFTQPASRFG